MSKPTYPTYWQSQLDRVKPDDTGIIRVKFYGAGDSTSSKFLSLTAEQFDAIRTVMLSVEGAAE